MINNWIKGFIIGASTYIVSFVLALGGALGMGFIFRKIWPDLDIWR